MKEGCSQNKWYSDPTDTSIGSRSCGFGVTRVALKRRIDAGRLMARWPLFTAVCHNFGYPICVIGSAGCGVFPLWFVCRVMPMVRWPLWFVMPCYAMVGWKSLISGDFPSDQGTGPEQQGTIWDKE